MQNIQNVSLIILNKCTTKMIYFKSSQTEKMNVSKKVQFCNKI
jgi:hypothetical protein